MLKDSSILVNGAAIKCTNTTTEMRMAVELSVLSLESVPEENAHANSTYPVGGTP